jgi:hypothetical protein
MGLSRSQAYEWLAVVQARTDEWVQLLMGRVVEGDAPLARLLQLARTEAGQRQALYEAWYGTRPAPDRSTRVSLGVATNLPALKSLVLANTQGPLRERMLAVDWGSPRAVKKAFSDFLSDWEQRHG